MTDSRPVAGSDRLWSAFLSLLFGNLLVTLSNLSRDVTIAGTFGASVLTDRFFLAVSIPIFLVTVAGGAYRTAILPLLVRLQSDASSGIGRLVSGLMHTNVRLILIGLALLLAMAAAFSFLADRPLWDSAGPGLPLMFALVLPMFALTCFIDLSQGPLQTAGLLFGPNLARCALPLGLVGGALWAAYALAGHPGAVLAPIIGGTLGAALGVAFVLYRFRAAGLGLGTSPQPLDAASRSQLSSNLGALVLATSITYSSPLVGQWIAGLVGPGAVSSLGYANRLTVGAVSLVTSALAPVLLGHFSQRLAREPRGALSGSFVQFAVVLAWTGCAMTLGCWLVSEPVVALVYERGQFTAADTLQVTLLTNCYALQFPVLLAGVAATTLISAGARNRIFVPIGIALFVINTVLSLVLMQAWGTAGIAVASAITYLVSLTLLVTFLHRDGLVSLSAADVRRVVLPFVVLGVLGAVALGFPVRLRSGAALQNIAAATGVMVAFVAAGWAVNASTVKGMVRSMRAG